MESLTQKSQSVGLSKQKQRSVFRMEGGGAAQQQGGRGRMGSYRPAKDKLMITRRQLRGQQGLPLKPDNLNSDLQIPCKKPEAAEGTHDSALPLRDGKWKENSPEAWEPA